MCNVRMWKIEESEIDKSGPLKTKAAFTFFCEINFSFSF